YQHRIYPIYAYVSAYASPFCDADNAVWVFDETPAGECKRNLNTYVADTGGSRYCTRCGENPPSNSCVGSAPNPGIDYGGHLAGYCPSGGVATPVPPTPDEPCVSTNWRLLSYYWGKPYCTPGTEFCYVNDCGDILARCLDNNNRLIGIELNGEYTDTCP